MLYEIEPKCYYLQKYSRGLKKRLEMDTNIMNLRVSVERNSFDILFTSNLII